MMTGIEKAELGLLGLIIIILVVIVIVESDNKAEAKKYELSKSNLKQCEITLKQVKESQNELKKRYDASLEALNISNNYNENQTNLIVGRNYGTRFYFVLTEGMNSTQISNIENHEICHQLINRDKKHFCM